MGNEARIEIAGVNDITAARQQGRAMAARLGFSGSEAALIAAAVSEVARNIIEYADTGDMVFEALESGRRRGLRITARDRGPGIANVRRAMEFGFSTGNGRGLGLPGAKWLMDEFEIESNPGAGTTITMKKWAGQRGKRTDKETAAARLGRGPAG